MKVYRAWAMGVLVAANVALAVALSEPGGAATIWTPPSSVKYAATCSTALPDATAAINAWLQGLKTQPGDTVQFAANQCYRTDESVILANKSSLTFNGNRATFASFSDNQKGRNSQHLEIEDDTNVTVENLNIVGSAPGGYFANLEAQHAFYILGGTGITINAVTANAVYGDFVALQNDVNRVTPTNITIENSQFGAASTGNAGAGRQELTIDDGATVTVNNNYFGHGSRSAVDIEPTSTSATIHNITIENNTFGPNPNYLFANLGLGATIKSVYFIDNTTVGRTLDVDSVDPNSTINRTDYRFIGNVSTTKQAMGNCENGGGETMRFVGVSSLIVRGNTQRMETPTNNTCQYLVDGKHIVGATITSNSLLNAWKVGVYDATSQVCEGGNHIGTTNPPSQLAPIDPPATLCPGFSG